MTSFPFPPFYKNKKNKNWWYFEIAYEDEAVIVWIVSWQWKKSTPIYPRYRIMEVKNTSKIYVTSILEHNSTPITIVWNFTTRLGLIMNQIKYYLEYSDENFKYFTKGVKKNEI